MIQLLSQQIRSRLEPLERRHSHCALIDFPNHSNVGDNAIWLGEIAWLADAGIRVRYRCDVKTYNRAALAQSLGADGAIFIHGGGNLGDLWPRHQRLRETVIRDFPTGRSCSSRRRCTSRTARAWPGRAPCSTRTRT